MKRKIKLIMSTVAFIVLTLALIYATYLICCKPISSHVALADYASVMTETTTSTTEETTISTTEETTTTTMTEPAVATEEYYTTNNNSSLCISMQMTYYSAGYGAFGSSGRTLVSGYSVACNSIPEGTIVHIYSPSTGIDGYFRVDDTGVGLGDSVIDIFYSSYDIVPSPFRQLGRVYCEVSY